MKKILSVILVVVAMMGIGVCLTSCEGEDDGYNDVAKHFLASGKLTRLKRQSLTESCGIWRRSFRVEGMPSVRIAS